MWYSGVVPDNNTERRGVTTLGAKRAKVHAEYYAIPAYLILARKSAKDAADHLGMCERSFKEKVSGFSDFTRAQAEKLSEYLCVTQDALFVTDSVA